VTETPRGLEQAALVDDERVTGHSLSEMRKENTAAFSHRIIHLGQHFLTVAGRLETAGYQTISLVECRCNRAVLSIIGSVYRVALRRHLRIAAISSASRKERASLSHRKPTTRSKGPAKAGAKAKPGARAATPIKARKGEKIAVLLSGGNPQIAKADGDAPVQEYIAAMPAWKRDLGKRLDALIVRNAPNVRKAVKWNSPFYGIEGQGWFLSFHVFTHYVKVTFFRGASLRPVPPGGTVRSKDAR
jgi:hypothetical protein